jgi:hypothetical protein
MADFVLEIRSQGWINGDPAGRYEDGSVDTCSHGSIYCEFGGVVLAYDEDGFGISQSGLQLLRTLEGDRTQSDRDKLRSQGLQFDNGFLLCHGCGHPISFGCTNFGIDWRVRHVEDEVILYDPLSVSAAVQRPVVQVGISVAAYARPIVLFARQARDFYFSFGPRFPVEEWERDMHDRFWDEYDERLARAERLVSD